MKHTHAHTYLSEYNSHSRNACHWKEREIQCMRDMSVKRERSRWIDSGETWSIDRHMAQCLSRGTDAYSKEYYQPKCSQLKMPFLWRYMQCNQSTDHTRTYTQTHRQAQTHTDADADTHRHRPDTHRHTHTHKRERKDMKLISQT